MMWLLNFISSEIMLWIINLAIILGIAGLLTGNPALTWAGRGASGADALA